MTNEEKAQELSERAIDYIPCNSTLPFYLNALKTAAWKDEQFKELIHKACHNFMQDLGERLGHIQLKAAAGINKFSYDEAILDKLDEIISATSDANKFMLTLEDYLLKELSNNKPKQKD